VHSCCSKEDNELSALDWSPIRDIQDIFVLRITYIIRLTNATSNYLLMLLSCLCYLSYRMRKGKRKRKRIKEEGRGEEDCISFLGMRE